MVQRLRKVKTFPAQNQRHPPGKAPDGGNQERCAGIAGALAVAGASIVTLAGFWNHASARA